MNLPFEFLLITSSVGALQSIFFSFYLLSTAKTHGKSGRLLGFLLLALAVRMTKSCAWYFSHDNLPAIIENVGYAAHLAIAPLLFLYVKSFVQETFVFKTSYWLHFLPSFATLFLSPFLDDWFWLGQFGGYFLSLYFFATYFPFVYLLILKNKTLSSDEKRWLTILTLGLNLVWAAYSANFLLGLVSYITAPTIFSLVIYPISFWALKQNGYFSKPVKYQSSGLTRKQIEIYARQVENLMKAEKIYRNPQITLSKLAKRINVSPQIVSEVINRFFHKNFADFINAYRLEDAMGKLQAEQNADKKIATVAFECGFGTLSSFNTLFKKHTGLTPSAYKQKSLQHD